MLWLSSFKLLLRRIVSARQAKAEDCARGVTAPRELWVDAAQRTSNPEFAELSRYFRDEHGRVHVLL
jgi:hypothetical protein